MNFWTGQEELGTLDEHYWDWIDFHHWILLRFQTMKHLTSLYSWKYWSPYCYPGSWIGFTRKTLSFGFLCRVWNRFWCWPFSLLDQTHLSLKFRQFRFLTVLVLQFNQVRAGFVPVKVFGWCLDGSFFL